MRSIFITFIAILVLVGCGSTPKYNTIDVQDTKVVYTKLPDDLLVTETPKKPLSKEEYLKLSPHKRESYLTQYSIDLLSIIKNYTTQITKIKELQP